MHSTEDDLRMGLAGFQQNLAEIDELLALDPEDEGVMQMRQEIVDGIALTMGLLAKRTSESIHPHSHSSLSSAIAETNVGDLVQVFENGVGNIGEVVSVSRDFLSVRFLGVGDEPPKNFPATACHTPPLRPSPVGSRVQAVSPAHNLWAEAIVEQVISQGVLVRFVTGRAVNSREWLSPARLQPLSSPDAPPGAPMTAIDPTAKPVRGTKAPHRQQLKRELKQTAEQAKWQQFMTKNKKVKRASETSIFKSPESEKGKVGVVGSGKDMTGKFEVRPKIQKVLE